MRVILVLVLSTVLVNAGFGQSFSEVTVATLPDVGNSGASSWADINNDGFMDILVSGDDGSSNIFTRILKNNGDDTFSDTGANLPDVFSGHSVWFDYNNDGYIDLLLNGTKGDGTVITSLYKNNGNSTFSAVVAGVTALSSGGIITADYNNDGLTDIFTFGVNASSNRVSTLYQNNGDDTFSAVTSGIAGMSGGAAVNLDYNNDGRTDILITGIKSNGQQVSEIYKNTGDFSFEAVATSLDKITSGDMAAGDYNNDGFSDVVITGFNSLGSRISKLYKNNGNGTFSQVAAGFTALSDGSVLMADFNSDGLSDVCLTGIDDGSNYHSLFYKNNGDDTFSAVATAIGGRIYGKINAADFNHDNTLDVLVTGFSVLGAESQLFENTIATANAVPSAPTGLTALSQDAEVQLSWNAATDDLTAAAGLGYNIYVGSASGAMDIVSAASASTGTRLSTGNGNMLHNLSYTLSGLAEGEYYWSVQALDNADQPSSFATEGSFVVCHNFSIGNDTTVCVGGVVSASAGTADDNVNWYSVKRGLLASGTNTYDFEVIEKDTLVAEMTRLLGCTIYDSLAVDIMELPSFSLGADRELCYDERTTLDAGTGWDEVNWYSPGEGLLAANTATYDHHVLKIDTLIAEVYNVNRCISYDSIIVDVIALPAISLGGDKGICYNESTLLDVGAGWDEVNWYSPGEGLLLAGSQSYNHQIVKIDTLIAEVYNASRCVSYDSVILDVIDLPSFSLGTDTAVCHNETILLDAGAGWDEVNWYSPGEGLLSANAQNYDHLVLKLDTLIAEVYNASRCVSYDSIIVDLIDLPLVDIGADTAVCFGKNILLDAGSGWDEVNWYSPGEGLVAAERQDYYHHVTKTDTLIAEIYNASRCVSYDSIIIELIALPAFDIGADTGVCYAENILLDAGTGWDEVNWHSVSKGLLAANTATFDYQVNAKDTLVAEAYNASRCVNYDSMVIDVIALRVVDIGADTAICYNETIILDAGTGWDEVNWHSVRKGLLLSGAAVFDYKVLETDTLIAEVYNSSRCVSYDSIIVSMLDLPAFDLGQDTTICYGESIDFSTGEGWAEVNWYTVNVGLIKPNAADLHYEVFADDIIVAEVYNASGCVSYDSIHIDYYAIPAIDAGADRAVCNNESTILGGEPTASGSTSFQYQWEPAAGLDDAAASNPVANPDVTTTYVLSVTTGNSCVFKDSVEVVVDPISDIDTGGDVEVCYGGSIQLGGTPTAQGSTLPYEFLWLPSATLSSDTAANPFASPQETTTYSLVTKTGGCVVDTSQVTVTVNPLPEVTVSPDITIGLNESTVLNASGGVEYLWLPFAGLNFNDIPDPEASPEVNTLYIVTVTDHKGCKNTDSVRVQVRSEIFVPNLFTPNGDDNNDTFKVYGTGIKEMTLRIFDRLGQLVFTSSDPDKGWNGTINGREAASDNYIWTLEGTFYNGEPLSTKNKETGIIKLVR